MTSCALLHERTANKGRMGGLNDNYLVTGDFKCAVDIFLNDLMILI